MWSRGVWEMQISPRRRRRWWHGGVWGTVDLIQCSSVEHREPQLAAGTTFFLCLDRAKLVRTNSASPGCYPQCQGMELRRAPAGGKIE